MKWSSGQRDFLAGKIGGYWPGGEVETHGSAKPRRAGSIPAQASAVIL